MGIAMLFLFWVGAGLLRLRLNKKDDSDSKL
jgi:hypothetical protein